jgi:ATP-binding cassette subfamily B (MDR/TAP) protein 7
VAIARAFLKGPRLLICDEATSALDSGTEAAILRSLKELAAGRTCVFVAHRLSTIKHCDRIMVMDAGVVVEEGTHQELIAKVGIYAHMWTLQESEIQRTAAIKI